MEDTLSHRSFSPTRTFIASGYPAHFKCDGNSLSCVILRDEPHSVWPSLNPSLPRRMTNSSVCADFMCPSWSPTTIPSHTVNVDVVGTSSLRPDSAAHVNPSTSSMSLRLCTANKSREAPRTITLLPRRRRYQCLDVLMSATAGPYASSPFPQTMRPGTQLVVSLKPMRSSLMASILIRTIPLSVAGKAAGMRSAANSASHLGESLRLVHPVFLLGSP